MKRILGLFFLSMLSVLPFSCKQEELASDIAEMKVEIVNKDNKFYSDEDIVIRIYTNHSTFKVLKFDFELCPTLIEQYAEYGKDNEYCKEFVGMPVIDKSHSGTIEIVIEDSVTGRQLTFKENYFAYLRDKNFSVELLNSRQGKDNLATTPLIMTDEDVRIRVRSKVSPLTLKELKSPVGNGDMKEGVEYSFKDGYVDFTIPKVKFTNADRVETVTLYMTFVDMQSGTEYSAGAGEGVSFRALDKLRVTPVSSSPIHIKSGEKVTVALKYNRLGFTIKETTWSEEFQGSSLCAENSQEAVQDYPVTNGNGTINLYTDGPVVFNDDRDGSFLVYVNDANFSMEDAVVTVKYRRESEKDVTISCDNLAPRVDNGKQTTVNISDNCPDATVSGKYKIVGVESDGQQLVFNSTGTERFNATSAESLYFSAKLNGNVLTLTGKDTYNEDTKPKARARNGKIRLQLTDAKTEIQKKAELTVNFIVRQRVYLQLNMINDIIHNFPILYDSHLYTNEFVVYGQSGFLLSSLDGYQLHNNVALLHVQTSCAFALRGWKSKGDFSLDNPKIDSYQTYPIDSDYDFSLKASMHFSTYAGNDRSVSNQETPFYSIGFIDGKRECNAPDVTKFLQDGLRNIYYLYTGSGCVAPRVDFDHDMFDLRAYVRANFTLDLSGQPWGTFWLNDFFQSRDWFIKYTEYGTDSGWFEHL